MESEDVLSAMLYFVTIVTSMGAAGAVAEACAALGVGVECADRIKVFIAFGFLTAFIAIPLLVAHVIGISIIKRFEIIVSPIVVVFSIVACAVGLSPKTDAGGITVLIMWYGLISASAAMFLALKNTGQVSSSKEKLVDPNPVSVPLTGSVTSSVPMQPVQPAPSMPPQPGTTTTPYSAPNSPIFNTAS